MQRRPFAQSVGFVVVVALACGVAAAQDQTEKKERQEILAVAMDAADRAMSERGLESVLDIVARTDRQRIEQNLDKSENKQFDELAQDLARKWREKYGHNFHAAANAGAFEDRVGIERRRDERGREVADLQFPAQGGRSRFTMRMIRDDNNLWRIQLPDRITGANFAGQMAKSLQLMQGQIDKWPQDRNEAYLNVTTQILHTLAYETNPQEGQGQMPGQPDRR